MDVSVVRPSDIEGEQLHLFFLSIAVETVKVHLPASPEQSYPVLVGTNNIGQLGSKLDLGHYSKIVVLSDNNVAKHWLSPLLQTLPPKTQSIVIAPGEEHKNVQTLAQVWQELVQRGADRKTLLVNLGGGVIGDLGGFAAACYMRGMDFVQVPTTLLAQVDASVGGKTAIDHASVKNSIGSFAQPKAVLIDINTLSTLPPRELAAGFAEVLKHGLIRRRSYFERTAAKAPKDFTPTELIELVLESVKIKAAVVESDEKESGPRKLLNFGHTAGHAFEMLSFKYGCPLLHGEAISLGILFEARLSQLQGYLNDADLKQIRQGLELAGLPLKLSFVPTFEETLALMRSDKKNAQGTIRWTLLRSIGEGIFDIEVPDNLVKEVFTSFSCEAVT